MISHGLISAALFLCVGVVYDRMHSRLISSYGGVVNYLPKYSLLFLIFALAGLGLPGTSGFLGEFLVLTGTFQKSYLAAMLSHFRCCSWCSIYVVVNKKSNFWRN